jgi:magnesium chelatase family protein
MGRLTPGQPLLARRPFRPPHHTISDAGLVGGGNPPTPGEISLSHNGVLFLDELPEFNRRTLEVLRQPLEDGTVTISRALHSTTFPADFMLVAALNPCPCGYYGDEQKQCTCSLNAVQRYQQRISGPLMDRIDIHLEMARVPFQKLSALEAGEPSAAIRARVEVQAFCPIDEAGRNLLRAAMQQMNLSARAYHRLLKLGRTIADLAGEDLIQVHHLAEALQYRPRPPA